MYLRHTTITKNGKSHTYWRLVRSVRTGNRVRQQTVAQLGELDASGRVRARALAEAIVGVERQPGLFDDPAPTEAVTVELRRLRLERGRRFGDVWLGLRLWQALGLDTLLESCLPPGREEVPWAKMAAVLVLARLCEPSSELHIAEDWFRRTALGDLLGITDDKVNDDRLYRALDQERGSRYIVGTPRSRLKQFARAVRRPDWEALREGLEVQRCPDGDGVETFILCRSAARAAKEQAMRERFVARIVAGLRKIQTTCRRQHCAVGKIERRVGRLLGQNQRAAGLFRARAGLGNSPTTVLEELARIHSTDVVAPTTDGRSIRLRCVVHPDKAQSILLSHLGLKLPQRLRLPSGMGQI